MTLGGLRSDHPQTNGQSHPQLAGRPRVAGRLTVVVVESDQDVLDQLTDAVAGQPIELTVCADPAEALLVVGRTDPDVVVLGPATGVVDDIAFLSILRRSDPDVPVVVGAGQEESHRAARATSEGATAIVQRPYRPAQLLALLQSLSAHQPGIELQPLLIELGPLRIDGLIPQIWLHGRHIELPHREFLLLRYLAERAGAVVGRDELLHALWDNHSELASNTLSVHVMRLRRRLGDTDNDSQRSWITAIRGLGYRLQIPHHDETNIPPPASGRP